MKETHGSSDTQRFPLVRRQFRLRTAGKAKEDAWQ